MEQEQQKPERTFVLYPYSDGTFKISGGGTPYVHTWNREKRDFDISGGLASSQATYNPRTGEFESQFTYQHVADYVQPRLAEMVRLMEGRKAGQAVGVDYYADGHYEVLEPLRESACWGISSFYYGKRHVGNTQ